ncbi:urease accessory UreF family protein [Paenibacillus hunanensis]|uniref:urease accessory protein UreF n=1 Tax=Paenibacillus hunanensis TaxID=539262 RepID=UPI002A69D72A|nr:urease accessory UreF family protein [Paenibacillus hunanensis]WPP40367.1 urease accessory UreF family protein [Paenibacillus hunanensis]
MKSNQKLLVYVQLLEAKLPTASFTHAHNLERHVQEGRMTRVNELEHYIHNHLQPHLFRWEAPAIYGVYLAEAQQDAHTLARMDHAIIRQIIEPDHMQEASQTGKRLLKLARNLYPWMSFELLEQAMKQHGAILSLTVLHAWINIQLGMQREQAIECYFYTLLSCCMGRVAKPLGLTIREAQQLTDEWSSIMEQQWLAQAQEAYHEQSQLLSPSFQSPLSLSPTVSGN